MKKILYTAVLSLFGLVVMAQNDVQYTHHLFNRLAYNPAYAGSQCAPVLNGTYRNQWAGLDKAPETGRLEFHTPFLGNRHGLGIGLTYDKAAIFRNTYVDLNYSYKIPISEKGTLALGIKGQFDNGRANFQDTNPLDLNDQFLSGGERTNTEFNIGVGAYYTQNNFYLGLSVPQLRESSFFDQVGISGDGDDFRTWYLMGGFVTDLSNNVKLIPGFLISQNSNAPFELDINANLVFMEKLWLGLNYRLGDSIDGLIQYQLSNRLRAGLSYDFTTTMLNNVSNGSVEANVNYMFGGGCNDNEISNLRFF